MTNYILILNIYLFFICLIIKHLKYLSEIIYYDNKNNKFSFNKTKLVYILNKYVNYIRQILNDINSDLKDITFYKNELNFPFVYKWFVYIIDNLKSDNTLIKNDDDNNQEKNETKNMIYELKIVLPKIKFKILKYETIIKNYLKKNLMIQLMKTNFLKWEELIMLELFFIKKFRIIINSILNNNKYCNQKISLISNHDSKNKNYMNKNKNLEFYISKTNDNCSYYYIFNPYTIILNNRKNKYHQEIYLSLKESKILYKYGKYWGIMNTLLKCININNEINNKVSFNFDILENISHNFFKISGKKKQGKKRTNEI
jgi:hypothetical protein